MTKNFISFKSITTAFCLASSVLSYAQNSTDAVSFEDVKLKQAILKAYPTVDANKDGEISFEEAKSIKYIRIIDPVTNQKINSAKGIEAFTNLTELNLGNNSLSSIDVSQLTLLSTLNLRQNQLEGTLDVSMLSNLKILELNNNKLTEIILPKQSLLNTIYANDNQLTQLDTSSLTGLTRLFLVRNKIKTLNLNDNVVL